LADSRVEVESALQQEEFSEKKWSAKTMYIPPAFAVQNQAALRDLMRRYPFATLVTTAGGVPFATHLPLLIEDRGEHGVLVGHLARANPQWRAFDGHTDALVIFSGPHGYVSPSLYETHPSVPTWNYMVAHVYGAPIVVEDAAVIRGYLLALIARFESSRLYPYQPSYDEDWLGRMMGGVVAFELPMTRIEGKFKLSQNRDEVDRAHVASAFAASASSDERALADWMRDLGIAPSS
jgi:transcriptional regulator